MHNWMSTDDFPKREFSVYASSFSESEAMPNRSNPMENPKPSQKPRREVWWLDWGATNCSLKSIGRCFEDRLNRSLLSSSNSLLRRIRSPNDDNFRRNLHQCPGYLREEINLTSDLSKSVIVSHAFPGLSERCSICHQLVQYAYSESFDDRDDSIISPYPSTRNNSLSPPSTPMKGALALDLFTSDVDLTLSDSSSVGEMFQPSLLFDEDIEQSMQFVSDPNVWQDITLPGINIYFLYPSACIHYLFKLDGL